jgi:protein SCO1/2
VIVVLAIATLARGTGGAGTAAAGATAPGRASTAAGDIAAGRANGSSGSVDIRPYLVPTPAPAPSMRLTDQDDRPFDLASLQGAPVFVFFGYTHCEDVCPATVGTVGLAMEAFGEPVRAVFVTVDPERDTPAWLREYVRYLAPGFSGVTGTPDRIAAVARDWGVRYAREETGTPGEYSMSHTTDVLLVDPRGEVRARFPFGTDADAMTATLRTVVATTIPIATPTPVATSPASPRVASEGLDVLVDSTSIWAGPAGPVILGLSAGGFAINDPDLVAAVQLASLDGTPVGPPVSAVAVRPPGESRIVYVASPAIPSPGWWRLDVSADRAGIRLHGATDIAALDPGTTAALGAPAPAAHTPTLDDAGGNARAVTTDPAPDLRLSRTSTTDALAAHRPFVLVIDSWKFRVTSACGKALVMARYLVDRWPDDAFIHLEPLRYDVVTDTPVLEGSLSDPTLTEPAAAWGLAGDPWGPTSMPWIFVVDGNGIVRAKAEGVVGTDDVDVILTMLAGH